MIFGLAKFTNIAEVTVQELREKQACLAKIFNQLELGETFGRFPFGCLKIRVVELERTVSVHNHLHTGKYAQTVQAHTMLMYNTNFTSGICIRATAKCAILLGREECVYIKLKSATRGL